jgi:hypothetical protein
MTRAVDTPNRFAEVEGRRLAYRSIGDGQPIVLCTRLFFEPRSPASRAAARASHDRIAQRTEGGRARPSPVCTVVSHFS